MEANLEVLNEKLNGLKSLINEKFIQNDETHTLILAQVTKVNGNVNHNTSKICKLEALKNKVVGGLIFGNLILVPIFLYLIIKYL